MDAKVNRPLVNGVRMQVLGGHAEAIEGGSLCMSAFILIFSSRRQSSEDEVTVSIIAGFSLLFRRGTLCVHRFCTPPSVTWAM